MATHRVSILGWGTIPDASGNVFFEEYGVKATNDVWRALVCVFNDTATRLGLRGRFTVPKNYVGSPNIIVEWTSTVTTNRVRWEFDYRAVGGSDTESMDQAGTQQSVGVTTASGSPSAVNEKMTATMALTAANLAVDDQVEFELFRDGTDATDDKVGAAILFEALFEYADV